MKSPFGNGRIASYARIYEVLECFTLLARLNPLDIKLPSYVDPTIVDQNKVRTWIYPLPLQRYMYTILEKLFYIDRSYIYSV